jgi:hypothetical protein
MKRSLAFERFNSRIVVPLAFLALMCLPIRADSVLVGATAAECSNCFGINLRSSLAQEFTLSEQATVDSIALGIYGTGNYSVFLTNQLSASSQIYFQGNVSNPTAPTAFGTDVLLNPGTYYLVTTANDSTSFGAWISAYQQQPTNNAGVVIPGFFFTFSTGGLGGDWNTAETGPSYPDLYFQIVGTAGSASATPEPTTFVLMLSGSGLLLLCRICRRNEG